MANSISETISESAQSAQEGWQRYYEDGEKYIRANPTKSALVGIGTGFLLAQLPLRWMIVALFKLLFLLVKPATFVYAISKLIDDVRSEEGTTGAETGF